MEKLPPLPEIIFTSEQFEDSERKSLSKLGLTLIINPKNQ